MPSFYFLHLVTIASPGILLLTRPPDYQTYKFGKCRTKRWQTNCHRVRGQNRLFSIFGAIKRIRLIDQMDLNARMVNASRIVWRRAKLAKVWMKYLGTPCPRLFRVADCVLHNSHDSEDALQDGLLSALRHIDQFKGNSQFSTWLFSIVRNSALAKLRKQRAHPIVSWVISLRKTRPG